MKLYKNTATINNQIICPTKTRKMKVTTNIIKKTHKI